MFERIVLNSRNADNPSIGLAEIHSPVFLVFASDAPMRGREQSEQESSPIGTPAKARKAQFVGQVTARTRAVPISPAPLIGVPAMKSTSERSAAPATVTSDTLSEPIRAPFGSVTSDWRRHSLGLPQPTLIPFKVRLALRSIQESEEPEKLFNILTF